MRVINIKKFLVAIALLGVFLGPFAVNGADIPAPSSMREPKRSAEIMVYKIGPEDKLKIDVWGNSSLSSEVDVRPDGRISLPLLGEIYVVGMSPNQLREELTRGFAEYINNPEITVTVLEVRSMKIHIFGNVDFAGPHELRGTTTLLEFFATNKIPVKVDLSASFIVRNGRKLPIDLYALIEQGAISNNIELLSGDLIYFMDRKEKRGVAAKKLDKIRVIGAVRRQVVLRYEDGLTVLDALMKAGGCTEEADKSKIKIIRKRDGNKADEVIVNISQLVDPEEKTMNNILLKPGDIVSVPRSWFAF